MAQKLVERGLEGDIAAIKEVGDRLDGKPAQAVEVGLEVQITRIERQIVDPRVIEHEPVEPLTAPLVAIPAPDDTE